MQLWRAQCAVGRPLWKACLIYTSRAIMCIFQISLQSINMCLLPWEEFCRHLYYRLVCIWFNTTTIISLQYSSYFRFLKLSNSALKAFCHKQHGSLCWKHWGWSCLNPRIRPLNTIEQGFPNWSVLQRGTRQMGGDRGMQIFLIF